MKFGTFYFDYDNDGRLDMLTCNGHIEPDISRIQASQSYAQPPQLFWNTGNPDCYFEPVTAKESGEDLFKPLVGRGSAFADLDGDGRLDIILAANGGSPRILRNDGPSDHHWVQLDLRGDGKKSNRSAIGAEVTIQAGDMTLHRQITSGRGYLEPVRIGPDRWPRQRNEDRQGHRPLAGQRRRQRNLDRPDNRQATCAQTG